MKAKDLRNSILQLAVEGKLVPQDPNDEPASVLLERIRKERAKLIAEGKIKAPKGGESVIFRGSDGKHYEKRGKGEPVCIEDEIPFEIPESWAWARLGSLFDMQAGKNIAASKIADTRDEQHPYACFGGNGIRGYVQTPNRCGCFPIIGRQGALCGCINYAEGEFYATEHAVVTTCFDKTDVEWACTFLEALNLNQYATATAQPGLAVSKIAEVLIPLPPLSEQARVVSAFNRLRAYVDDYGILESARNHLDAELPDKLRKSILQLAVQGKLVEQDPDDEPASELLERIRDERSKLIAEGKLKAPKGGESVIFRGSDGGYYEKRIDTKGHESEPVCIDDEIPFDIPESWAWARLGTVVLNRQQEKPDADFCYIDIGSIDNAAQQLNASETIVKAKYAPSRARKPVERGDVIYATVRPYLHNACIIDRVFSCKPIASTGFAAMVCPDGLYNKYLLDLLISPYFDSYANDNENSKGVAYPAINDARLYMALVPIPPTAEQMRIVGRIEEAITNQ